MFMGAKTNWSAATRAAIVRFVVEREMRVARRVYHFVAAGPKMPVGGRCRISGVFEMGRVGGSGSQLRLKGLFMVMDGCWGWGDRLGYPTYSLRMQTCVPSSKDHVYRGPSSQQPAVQ